jgi:hypothetical protein
MALIYPRPIYIITFMIIELYQGNDNKPQETKKNNSQCEE